MYWLLVLFASILAVLADDLPEVDLEAQWGPTVSKNSDEITPFEMTFDDDMIADLRMRLKYYRRPAPTFDSVNFEYGFNTNSIDSWITYWAEEYDFKARELAFNSLPQHTAYVQGLRMHFIRVEPENKNKTTIPLLLLHGWPGSVREFYELIPYLVADAEDRDFGIEIIAASLPGFGCSDAANRPGLGGVEMAVVLRNLMRKIGHEKFYIHGGDWGAYIASAMCTLFPTEVQGYHTNLPLALTSKAFMLMAVGSYFPELVVDTSLADRIYPLSTHASTLMAETGYFHFQATKPDTLGVAMTDSPAGLLAFFLQSFSSGTRRNNTAEADGGLLRYFTRDQLLDNLMLYWSNNKITTSSRIYYETLHSENATAIMAYPTQVPLWAIQAPDEIMYMSPIMLKTKFPNLLHTTVLDDGGHFLALEKPEILAEDIFKAMTAFIQWHKDNDSSE